MEPKRKTIITDDGELRDVPHMEGTPESAIYCSQCGTSNRSDSHFCRSCGNRLDEDAYAPREKPKRTLHEQSAPNVWSAATEIATMFMVLIMCSVAIRFGGAASSWVVIPMAIGWLATAGIRHSGSSAQHPRPAPNVWSALIEIATVFIVMVMSSVAVYFGEAANSWLVVPIVIAWIGTTVIRNNKA